MTPAKRKSIRIGGVSIRLKNSSITIWIIGVLILIFLLDIATRYLIDGTYSIGLLSLYGMRINEKILSGEYWRLITPIALHGNWSHLLLNCLALFLWGRLVENLYGSTKFLCIMVLSGIMGCVLGFAFSNSNSLGASGMVYGLFGALIAFRKHDKAFFSIYFGIQLLVFIALSYGSGLLQGGIDNWAHLGGFIGGFLSAEFLGSQANKEFKPLQILWFLLYILITSVLIYIRL